MNRVTGIGGIFFKSPQPEVLKNWYKTHLGIDIRDWGGAMFSWSDTQGTPTGGTTTWSISDTGSTYFAPSTSTFMINYRVENLHELVEALKQEGCEVFDKIEESEYGKFAWVIDPDGNKVELWEPPVGM